MSIALLFNGQGAHYKGMGQDFVEKYPEALSVYEKVEQITNYPVREQITTDFKKLKETQYAQVAIAATSLAIYESIKAKLPAIDYMAGLSLGEYSSLITSGYLSFDLGFKLLKKRGQLMTKHCQKLNENADLLMVAVIDMPLEKIKEVISEVDEDLYIANLNSSTQIILAGTKSSISKFRKNSKNEGYKKILPLKVEGPFHSPYMSDVLPPYQEVLNNIEFQKGVIPVISNTIVEPHTVSEIRGILARHLVEPVRWEETIQYLINTGVKKVIQIGPGNTLANLLKREKTGLEVLVIDKVDDVEKIESFIGG